MPAVLNEAFSSPFIQFRGLNPHGQALESSSGTESIHLNAPPPVQIPAAVKVNDLHDCDRLIATIMSCAHCRNKLRNILINQSAGAELPVPKIPELPKDVPPAAISNFIFGIAVLFLVDRIIKLCAAKS
jgi:hypothetical protein